MAVIRGRIGQFYVLRGEQALIPYLLPTIRLTQQSFFALLEKHGRIVLKPVVGLHFITVTKEEAGYVIVRQNKRLEARNKACAYDSVMELKENPQYVIQPVASSSPYWRRPFQRFITLQRRAGYWNVTASTKIARRGVDCLLVKLYEGNIRAIATLAAETLHTAYPNVESIVVEMTVNLVGEVFIHDTVLHFSVSKWSQYQLLRAFMPTTDLLTEATWHNFLTNYEEVFLKPCNGQQGRGIVKVTREGKRYTLHRGRKKIQLACTELQEHLPIQESMIIQQGIPLARIQGAVFDIRVLVKKRDGDWVVHKKAVKVAGDDYIVTNAAQAIYQLEQALEASTVHEKNAQVLHVRVDTLCLQAATLLDTVQPRTIIGFDIGMTDVGELYIFEGNYMPDLSMFHQLKPKPSP